MPLPHRKGLLTAVTVAALAFPPADAASARAATAGTPTVSTPTLSTQTVGSPAAARTPAQASAAGLVDRLAASAGQAFARARGTTASSPPAAAARAFLEQHRDRLGHVPL